MLVAEGANPDTCQHRVLYPVVDHPVVDGSTRLILCVSCNSTISPEYWLEHTYDYSNGLGFWIERPDDIRSSRMERAQAPADSAD